MNQQATLPMPPMIFKTLVCGPTTTDDFEAVGGWLLSVLDHQDMLKDGIDLLDVGCGCGRLARFLLERPVGSYTGFDRHKGMVDWCEREITSRDPRFRFDHFELKSVYVAWDGEQGSIDVEAFTFPYPAEAFDSVVLSSVFTHMPPNEVRHYLGELVRVMRPGAKALLSIFLSPGAVEVRDDGINIFHNLDQFLADAGDFSFDARLISSATPALSFSYEHNWYVLTCGKSPSGTTLKKFPVLESLNGR
jgi:SAM-dependent methyltransferase